MKLNMIGQRVIIRSEGAGVFYGTLEENDRANSVVTLSNARRLHYWSGVPGGTTGLACCKELNNKQEFSDYVDLIEITKVTEINKCSKEAIKAIEEVQVWTLR